MGKVREEFHKLVRDRIPDFARARGEKPSCTFLGDDDFRAALKQKLVEEAQEAAESSDRGDLANELADVLEVVETLARASGLSLDAVRDFQKAKRSRNGGFDKRIFLRHIDKKEKPK